MTDINAVIAKHKGWKVRTIDIGSGIDVWTSPHGMQCAPVEIPDYLHDARLYMALFEEMSSEFFSLSLMQHDYNNKTTIIGDYRQGHDENTPQFVVEAEPIGGAICQAYAKLHGLECEG